MHGRRGFAAITGLLIVGASLLAGGTEGGAASRVRARSLTKARPSSPAEPLTQRNVVTASGTARSLDERLQIASTREVAAIAAANDRTPAQLRRLRNDPTLRVSSNNRLLYVDTFDAEVPEVGPPPGDASTTNGRSTAAAADFATSAYPFDPFTGASALFLHSRPGASKTLFLDFDGATITGVQWNVYVKPPVLSMYLPPYDLDKSPSTFNSEEMSWIADVWETVAEDFAPFDIDVTTQQPSDARLNQSSPTDNEYGSTVVISPVRFACPDCAGIAWVGGVGDSNYQPALAFPTLSYYRLWPHQLGSTISHEAGHTFGLDHDGTTDAAGGLEYYGGHGNFAPIMGSGAVWRSPQHQWSKGEYANANNTEDDIAIIASHAAIVPDDVGDSPSTATPLSGTGSVVARKIISTDADVDRYIYSPSGCVTITATPVRRSPNLDLRVGVGPAAGEEAVAADPAGAVAASVTVLSDSSVGIAVSGEAYLGPISGYSGYSSLGYYNVTIDPVNTCRPRTVTTGTIGNRNVQLSWLAPTVTMIEPVSYTVTLCPTTNESCASAVTAATSVTVSSLLPQRTYNVSVSTGSGAALSSGAGVAFVSRSAPAAPAIRMTPGAAGAATLTWTPPADYGDAITSYDVQIIDRATGAIRTQTVADGPVALTGLPTDAVVSVRANNANGPGPWGNSVSSGRGSAPAAPGPTFDRGSAPAAPGPTSDRGSAPAAPA